MMQKRFKQLVLLAAMVPAFAMAQSLSNQTSAPAAAAPIDADKKAAIKDLLDAIDAPKLVSAIANSAEMQSKQLVPAILSDALSENKTLNDKQKQAAVPTLQKNAVPKLVDGAGKVFGTQQFTNDAMQAQYDAYAKYWHVGDQGSDDVLQEPDGPQVHSGPGPGRPRRRERPDAEVHAAGDQGDARPGRQGSRGGQAGQVSRIG